VNYKSSENLDSEVNVLLQEISSSLSNSYENPWGVSFNGNGEKYGMYKIQREIVILLSN